MKYIINYFKYAGRAKGLLAGRIEYLVGYLIYIISSILITLIDLVNIALLPEDLENISAPLVIIFLIPYIALVMRRLQDLNLNRFLGLLSIPIIIFVNITGLYIAHIIFLLLAIIPSAKVNKYVTATQLLENLNKNYEPRDNPIIGFRPKRFLKILFLFIFLPIISFILMIFIFGS